VLRNVGSNWVLTLVTVIATYITMPFIIHTLGDEGYGTWTLITAITGYMGLLALGVPMACVRYLAQHVTEKDPHRINQTIGSCAGLYLAMGAVALIAGLAFTFVFTVIYRIPAGLEPAARLAFALMAFQVSASFIGLLPEGIMFAHHDFVARNVIRVAAIILRLVLTIALLTLSPSIVVMAIVQILWLAFDFGVSLFVIRRRYPEIRLTRGDFQWAVVRRIFSFSLFVLLLAAGARLTFETDALVIGAILGVGFIPFYAVANSLIVYLMDFLLAIAAVVSPMATKLNTTGEHQELREMFLRWSKVALSVSLMAGLFLIVLGPRFIGWWIGPEFEGPSGTILQILMISCLAFLPVRGVALPVLMGIGRPRAATFAFIGAGVLNLVLSVVLAYPFGLAGVALGTAIPNVLFAAVVLVIACRDLGITVSKYLKYVVPRAAFGALPALALLLWFKFELQVQNFGGLAAAGTAMLALFAATWVLFVYRDDPYVDLTPHLTRLRVWSRA
jgi:O-antigen/teichoic acid export membrane protein